MRALSSEERSIFSARRFRDWRAAWPWHGGGGEWPKEGGSRRHREHAA